MSIEEEGHPLDWFPEPVTDAFGQLRKTLDEMERVMAEADAMGPLPDVSINLTAEQSERLRLREERQVYVAEGSNGLIKIGFSRFPEHRVGQLQTTERMRVRLIGTIFGGRPEEAALHRRFAADRACGEWFFLSLDLAAFIRDEVIRE